MSEQVIAQRLRQFLLLMAGAICAGAVVELLLNEHTQTPVQFVPFILCGLAMLAVGGALLRPQRPTLLALRIVMALVALGSLLGIYEHLMNNLAFELEIRPNAAMGDVLLDALKGANPLLAPGTLGVAALLAFAATYYHPALRTRRDETSA